MRKSYTVQEILFALRKEYLDVRQQLEALEKYVVPSKKVNDYTFILTNASFDDPEIRLYCETKKNLLEKLLIRFRMYYNSPQYSLSKCDENGNFYENGTSKILGSIIDREELLSVIRELEKNDWFSFLGKFWDNSHINVKDAKNVHLTIEPASTMIYGPLGGSYLSYHDRFYFVNLTRKGVVPADILETLNYEVDKSELNVYYQSLIDTFLEEGKDVIWDFSNMKSSSPVAFAPQEDQKSILLKPVHMEKNENQRKYR